VTAFVVAYRDSFGLEPICRVLQIASSAVRARLGRPISAREIADEVLKPKIRQVFDDNYQVYGRRKIKAGLRREYGLVVDKDRIARLMRELGIRGVSRSKSVVTTRSDKSTPRAPDLVKRRFQADRPNQLWVSDFTYVPTWSGFVYTAFIIDVYSRMIVGWRVSSSMTTDLVMDALNMAAWTRRTCLIDGVIAHSDAGSQYVSIAYSERLAELGARPSVGTVADSFDNAMAEAVNALYKTELIKRKGPWRNAEHVELATLAYVEWFNQRRLHSEIGDIPPAEYEDLYYHQQRLEYPVPTTTGT
jgi:putative transposase